MDNETTWEVRGFGTPLYTNVNYPFNTSNPLFKFFSKKNRKQLDKNNSEV